VNSKPSNRKGRGRLEQNLLIIPRGGKEGSSQSLFGKGRDEDKEKIVSVVSFRGACDAMPPLGRENVGLVRSSPGTYGKEEGEGKSILPSVGST